MDKRGAALPLYKALEAAILEQIPGVTVKAARNGMNLYRGCQHGCIYCDSRSDCYHMEHDFEDVEVKENALTLLENALRRKRKSCMIGAGSMSDPYMPLEENLRYTRQALELFHRRCERAGILYDNDRIFRYLSEFEEKRMPQMSLF